jgi:uncharacterized Tic20 family protein
MTQRFCPTCKTVVGGFAYCPKCGGQTELLAVLPEQAENQPYSAAGVNTSRQSALWCHLGPLIITVVAALTGAFFIGILLGLFAWVPPLVIKSSKKADEFVIEHAKESFNFQVFWIIATYSAIAAWLFIGVITLGIGLVVGFLFWLIIIFPLAIFIIVVQIRGCLAASAGRTYKYPLVLFRLMK